MTEETKVDRDAELYGVICDTVERAWQQWPVERGPDEVPVLHTSSYARQAANRIMAAVADLHDDDGDEQPTCEDLVFELRVLCEERGWDFSVKVDTGHQAAWAAEVRVTRKPNDHGRPDRSHVTYNTGGADADDALWPAVADMLDWLKELDS